MAGGTPMAGGSAMGGGGGVLGCGVGFTDAGSPLPLWNGAIEPIALISGWRVATDLPNGVSARRSLLFPFSTPNGLVLHFPRRVEGGRVSTVGHTLQLSAGAYCGPNLPLYDVMSVTMNRGVLGIGEWDQLTNVATDGGDRRVRYFNQATFSPLDGGAWASGWGGAVGGAAFLGNGSIEPLVLGNVMGRGQSSHRTGGNSVLPCELFPGPVHAFARDGGDVMLALGRCDGGIGVFSVTEDGLLAQTALAEPGTSFELAAGRSNSSGPVFGVMRNTDGGASELELTRFTNLATFTGSASRRLTFVPQVTIKGLAIDDFDQPMVLVGAASPITVIDNSTGADASVVTSSALAVLQLDSLLNPARFGSISYPAFLNSRSLVSTSGAWVVEAECTFSDGGTTFPCPSTRTSFAMRLVLSDGGAP